MDTIIISSVVADLNGSMRFKIDPGKSDILSLSRRVSKKATLDGGSVTDDFGFTHSDRTFMIVAKMTGAQVSALNYMVENFTSITVSTVDGLFLGSFQNTKVRGTEVTIKILIKEMLTP
jgi:hypothetical protein